MNETPGVKSGRRKLLRFALIFVVAGGLAIAARLAMTPERETGVDGMTLKPCPDTPNCVSTQATRESQQMEPIPFEGSADDARRRLKTIVESLPRTNVVEERDNYLHAESRSLVFRFVDDVEFVIDESASVIHFRAASRLGTYDLNVNRKRMEKIRRKFEAAS